MVLEDGRTFHGASFGAEGETFGEMALMTGDATPADEAVNEGESASAPAEGSDEAAPAEGAEKAE